MEPWMIEASYALWFLLSRLAASFLLPLFGLDECLPNMNQETPVILFWLPIIGDVALLCMLSCGVIAAPVFLFWKLMEKLSDAGKQSRQVIQQRREARKVLKDPKPTGGELSVSTEGGELTVIPSNDFGAIHKRIGT